MKDRLRFLALVLVFVACAACTAAAVGPVGGGEDGRNVTTTALWTAASGRIDSITLGFGDLATLVWWRDDSGWFPVWRVSLVAEAGLLLADGTEVVAEGRERLNVASTVAPAAGHTYELSLSYESSSGALGLRIVDLANGNVIADHGVVVHPGLAMPGSVASVQTREGSRPLETADRDRFEPRGVQWAVRRLRGDEPPFYVTDRHPYVEPGDRLALELETPIKTSGMWRLSMERAGAIQVLAQVPADETRVEVALPTVTREMAGPFTLRLEYLDGGQVASTRELRLFAGSATLALGRPTFDETLHAATVAMKLDTTVPLAGRLTVTARLTEVIWNEESLRYEEVPVDAPRVVFGELVDVMPGQPLELNWAVPLPPYWGTFKLNYDVEPDFAVDVPVTLVTDRNVVNTGYADVEFSVVTYNLWGTNQWPRRAAALEAVLQTMQPDILGVQEFKLQHREAIAGALPNHQLVADSFIGWLSEGNIYWSTERFELVDYGAEEIGICEPWRRLFWVRLQVKGAELGRTLLVANAHYTWDGHDCIQTRGTGLRVDMAKRTLDTLERLRLPDEPVIFMGDLNESGAAIHTLRAGGLRDSVGTDGSPLQHTYPADPRTTAYRGIIDWQFHAGPIKVIESGPVDFFLDGVVPSDHKPVLVRYHM